VLFYPTQGDTSFLSFLIPIPLLLYSSYKKKRKTPRLNGQDMCLVELCAQKC
uniref:Uncharacterized protein n=1 Tax=Aegilops tauschii subsp. strangulata TaxID=200361 RepID=A0A453Q9Y8_AEGTS